MKSIKPGRGPSMMSGIVGLFVAGVGVLWTFLAVSLGGGFMAIFGIIFILIALVSSAGGFYNATAENRTSIVDIVDGTEEPDPLEPTSQADRHDEPDANGDVVRFCPYCGRRAQDDHRFCAGCGKPLN